MSVLGFQKYAVQVITGFFGTDRKLDCLHERSEIHFDRGVEASAIEGREVSSWQCVQLETAFARFDNQMIAVGFQVNVTCGPLGNIQKQLTRDRDSAVLAIQNRQAGADFQIKICAGDAQLSFVSGQEHVAKNRNCRSGFNCLRHCRQGVR
jgi:hypothetical protein